MSSMSTVAYNLFEKDIYTLKDWSDTSIEIGAYRKSKTLAEKEAWQYVNDQKDISLNDRDFTWF